jgi:osmotically-inducible protein OsmY
MKTDEQIKADVESELRWEPSVNATTVGVAVRGGAVTLSGHVRSYAEKMAALQAAERVSGVVAVADELEVRLPGEPRSDTEIAEAIASALDWNAFIPRGKLKAEVHNGWVTLTGEVDWAYQRNAAERAVRDLGDVKGLTNLIRVKPVVTASEVKEDITAALTRNAMLDARNIWVETSNGNVQLRGTVHSLAEARTATNAAWAAPGVSKVESYLEVKP